MKLEPTENDSVGYYERTATIVTKDDGSRRIDVGLVYSHSDDELQYILHRILQEVHRIEMDISCDPKLVTDFMVEQQKKPTFIIKPCQTNR